MKYFLSSRGEEFRKEYKGLSTVRAFFPNIPVIALTATAPPHLLNNLKNTLNLKSSCKVVSANPNRNNIFLAKKMRMSNHHVYESYSDILLPIAKELSVKLENYPMTVIYMKLKYCGYAYGLFERVLQEKQYVGETNDPAARLFAQFHAPQTNEMKKSIISEIKKRNSRVRVIFATSALGMGVDAPDIRHVIHITPPSSIESYVQEISRAGRTGQLSSATLYYNNSDISNNMKHINKSMKDYCQLQDTCLRQFLLNYLGFSCVKQERCCCVCEEPNPTAVCNEPMKSREKVRLLTTANTIILQKLILNEVYQLEVQNSNSPSLMLMKSPIPCKSILKKIMTEIEFIRVESDLLDICGISDEQCSSKIFSIISKFAPLR